MRAPGERDGVRVLPRRSGGEVEKAGAGRAEEDGSEEARGMSQEVREQ